MTVRPLSENSKVELTIGRLITLVAAVLTLCGAVYAGRESILSEARADIRSSAEQLPTRGEFYELREELRIRLTRVEDALARLERRTSR
jgi:hypothetical protein